MVSVTKPFTTEHALMLGQFSPAYWRCFRCRTLLFLTIFSAIYLAFWLWDVLHFSSLFSLRQMTCQWSVTWQQCSISILMFSIPLVLAPVFNILNARHVNLPVGAVRVCTWGWINFHFNALSLCRHRIGLEAIATSGAVAAMWGCWSRIWLMVSTSLYSTDRLNEHYTYSHTPSVN
jgi:hypothetical protein